MAVAPKSVTVDVATVTPHKRDYSGNFVAINGNSNHTENLITTPTSKMYKRQPSHRYFHTL